MSSQEDIKELETSIQQARVLVELGSALQRLQSNRDFRTIVNEGYFQKEAVRLVLLRSDPAMETAERQASIVKQMDAIAGLHQYFAVLQQQAAMAARNLNQAEEELVQVLAEEVTP